MAALLAGDPVEDAWGSAVRQEQGTSGLGLDAQEAARRDHCEQRRWVLAGVYREIASGAMRKRRIILDAAVADLHHGDVLIVAMQDRLARSLSAYIQLIDRSRRRGWAIVAADGTIDLTTPHGRAIASMSAVFAELEADLIGDRTRVALAAAKARGKRLGRKPAPLPPDVVANVKRWRRRDTLHAVADRLNEGGYRRRRAGGGIRSASLASPGPKYPSKRVLNMVERDA